MANEFIVRKGLIIASGSLSGSAASTGSFGRVEATSISVTSITASSAALSGDMTFDDITASGNIVSTGASKVISGSSTSTGSFGLIELHGTSGGKSIIRPQSNVLNGILHLEGGSRATSPGSYIQLYGPNNNYGKAVFNYGYDQTHSELSFAVNGTEKVHFGGRGKITATSIETIGISNAGGNISGSATSTGSFGHGYIDGKLGIGTTSPQEKLDLKSGRLIVTDASTPASNVTDNARVSFSENISPE